VKKLVKNIFVILNQREKQKLWILAIADAVISILDIFFLIGLLYLINFYTQPPNSSYAQRKFPAIMELNPLLLTVIFFLLFVIKNALGFIVARAQYQFVYNVASRLSKKGLSQYLDTNYAEFVNINSSVINRKISQAPIEFCHYVLHGVQQVFSQSVLILITTIAIVMLNPLLLPLLLLILLPPVILIVVLVKRKLGAARLYEKQTGEKAIQHLQEALAGYIESNVYDRNDFFVNRYHRFQSKLNHYLSDRLTLQSMSPRLIEIFAVFGFLILVCINFFAADNHPIQLVTIGTLMVAAYKIIPGIVKIMNTGTQIKAYAFTAKDLAGAAQIPLKVRNTPGEALRSVAFENISFEYPDKKILSSFSLRLEKGDFACIAGISGKGKTTLVNLLLGFLTPDAGSIYINGNASNTDSRQNYWNNIAYIKQQPFFLHASIIENISMQEQGYDKQQAKKAIELTGLDKLIDEFPEGLQTVITENGKNISGGQRQRIVFARALYRNADLLILDEPFSELDEAAEMELLKVLQNISADGKIIILITHNNAAFSFCNKKIVMDE
jgi:ABC-type multidrug transport system fused ATPase/permease subunit